MEACKEENHVLWTGQEQHVSFCISLPLLSRLPTSIVNDMIFCSTSWQIGCMGMWKSPTTANARQTEPHVYCDTQ